MCRPGAQGDSVAERFVTLNQSCLCLPIDRAEVDRKIVSANPVPGLAELLAARPHLFAGTSVFLSDDVLSDMYEQIEALEAIVRTDAFRAARLNTAASSLLDAQPATRGVMMGYDFHIAPNGPKLIEINTNAGGAYLIAALQEGVGGLGAQKHLTATFISEWRRARRSSQPKTIAIVDQTPEEQYLYPDMLLARQWLEITGIDTFILDPSELRLEDGVLTHKGRTIDMVYNRLTDFAFDDPAHITLRNALETDAAVISPAPRHHALHAHKFNLAWLSETAGKNDGWLSHPQYSALSRLPKTEIVSPDNAEALWANRRNLFFKPAAGFASRAAYRGSKLTRRVWEEILSGEYVAQDYVCPTYRAVEIDGNETQLKYDVRVYTYDGAPLALAARVYQGQTTNFRSPGGGFAPIITENASPC